VGAVVCASWRWPNDLPDCAAVPRRQPATRYRNQAEGDRALSLAIPEWGTELRRTDKARHGSRADGSRCRRARRHRREQSLSAAEGGARGRRAHFAWLLQLGLSVALVAWLVSGLDWAGVAATLSAADAGQVAAALAALAPIPLLASERWRQTCAALNVALARRFFVPATYAALFAGQFLPSGIGMDAVRLGLLWRQRVPLAAGVQSLAIDRMCGVTGLLVLLYAGLPFAFGRPARDSIALATALLIAARARLFVTVAAPRGAAPRPCRGAVARARAASARPGC
jgi:hypothetical protein